MMSAVFGSAEIFTNLDQIDMLSYVVATKQPISYKQGSLDAVNKR